jgi:hypothetical protein
MPVEGPTLNEIGGEFELIAENLRTIDHSRASGASRTARRCAFSGVIMA